MNSIVRGQVDGIEVCRIAAISYDCVEPAGWIAPKPTAVLSRIHVPLPIVGSTRV